MSKPSKSIRVFRWLVHPATVIAVVLVAAFLTAWAWPKVTSESHFGLASTGSNNSSTYTVYGGFNRFKGLLGRKIFRFRYEYSPRRGTVGRFYFNIDYQNPGLNAFESTYPNGTLQSKGMWNVRQSSRDVTPYLSLNDVWEGNFYRPDGSLGSSVKSGTGSVTLWYPNGAKLQEFELRDGQPIRTRMWSPTGVLEFQQNYADGLPDTLVQFDAHGRKQVEGKYLSIFKDGPWTYYRPDGGIEKIEHYKFGPLTRTEYPGNDPATSDSSRTPSEQK